MTEHEDLIAEANRLLTKNQWTSGWGVESLAERLVDALEAVERERDRLDEAFDRDLPWRYDEVEAQRNQLAAVVERVRQWRHDWFNEPVEGVKRKPHHRRLDNILDSAPTVALDHVKAEAVRDAASNVRASSFWADGSDNYADRVRGYLTTYA